MESKKSDNECEKDSPKKVEFFSNIFKFSITGKLEGLEFKETKGFDYIKIFEQMDNTKPEIILAKLLSNKNNDKLLFKNFNVISKNDLSELGINKRFNNRETYFYFLEYLIRVEYFEDNIVKNRLKDKTKKYKNKDSKTPKLIIDFSNGKIDIMKIDNIKDDKIIINDNENYMELISRINVDIAKVFIFAEIISIEELRKKMKQFYDNITFKEEKLNNIPDFQSEIYYHYELLNILETFEESNDTEFAQKIEFIKDLSDFIFNVRDNKIHDILILNYFYFIMDVENKIDIDLRDNANHYEEKYDYKNCKFDKEKNELIITDDKKIANFDCYKITEDNIENIKQNKMPLFLIFQKRNYSLKGNLLFQKLTKKEGNEIYENFINSNLLKDIFKLLYEIDIISLNYKNLLIRLFQDNTFYFPIQNDSYAAYTNKKSFKIIIDCSVDLTNIKNHDIDEKIILFVKKAFMIVNTHHEFGHGINVILFYINPNKNEFESPLVKLKLNTNKEEITKEGGRLYEYLIYGRIIKTLDLREIIYINNVNNYNKNLIEYRDDFINLQNKNLIEVFEEESKNNEQISEIYELYKQLPEDKKQILINEKFKPGKLNKEDYYSLENMVFSTKKLCKSHDKHKKKH